MRVLVSAVIMCLLVYQDGVEAAPAIDSPWGQIVGVDGTTSGGVPYSAYQAIPYALPPLGSRRFAKPQPHPGPGQGQVFNASSPGSACVQNSWIPGLPINEDCLTLSVYVPTPASDKCQLRNDTGSCKAFFQNYYYDSTVGQCRQFVYGGCQGNENNFLTLEDCQKACPSRSKPVMIWIHGGGFTLGSALDYTPSVLVTSRDVIVVVIQYRLDALGFLSSGDDVSPGNYAMWDQVMAVQWVKDNIQAFGGDPQSITIFGESAGAAAVGLHILSPSSKDLKYRAVMQSGTPIANFAVSDDPRKIFYALSNATGCMDSTGWSERAYYMVYGRWSQAQHVQMLECLRGKEAGSLVRALLQVPGIDATGAWQPAVDGDFLPRHPDDLMRDVNHLDDVGATSRDVMLGITNQEGALFLQFRFPALSSDQAYPGAEGQRTSSGFDSNVEQQLQQLLTEGVQHLYGERVVKDKPTLDMLLDVLDFFYTQPLKGGQVDAEDVVDILTDMYFTVPAVKFIRELTQAASKLQSGGRAAGGRRYLYLFNHYPVSKAGEQLKGISHAGDLEYLFDYDVNEFNADDFTLATTFKRMLSTFAVHGVPRLDIPPQEAGVWPEYTMNQQQYLSLEPVPRVDSYLYGKRVALWLDLLPSLVNSTHALAPWRQGWLHPSSHTFNPQTMTKIPLTKHFMFKGNMRFFKMN